ncbi:PREDICTED: DNA-binding protein HEXBP-like [Camelina sativa]|uniref:DNA-binding protein HEXBP-like n=1 Tax=Camelina sativa TaxID=90675 RepID=A0ABM1QL23_CAMSA|nr:PREDICTED: DNA-binding protein HEXBP-like [Camelina sativa]
MPRHNAEEADVCLRCGELGHDMILCKYDYTQEDLKDIKCYVCKSLGHLCCIEPCHSPSWTLSCYRCGQLGHTGLACGRHYDDSVSPSCFKCAGEGRSKCHCPDSSSICSREEGHFSRECPNPSSSISESKNREAHRLCYKCKGRGLMLVNAPFLHLYRLRISLRIWVL